MKKFFKVLWQIISGEFLKHPELRPVYPFLLFLVVLALLWIGNTYTFFSTSGKIEKTKAEIGLAVVALKEREKIYSGLSVPSRLVERLDSVQIKMSYDNIYRVVVNENEGGEK
ncbi:MAG: FtsL-like putative cell division protein [Bacteroidales bacterium]|nr:FtsL-like putative cell division protein [Bacteroidales bacterium]